MNLRHLVPDEEVGTLRGKKIALLLTGTVKPREIEFTADIDPVKREHEYMHCISRTRQLLEDRGMEVPMVFAENSGGGTGALSDLCNRLGVECLSVRPDEEIGRGKGYAELGIIKKALAQSKTLAEAETVIKLTGRYVLQNVASIGKFVEASRFDVAANLYRRLSYADSRCFAFNRQFIDILLDHREVLNDRNGVYLEHALAAAVWKARTSGLIWKYLNDYPIIEGISGTTGIAYRTSHARCTLERAKLAIYRRIVF